MDLDYIRIYQESPVSTQVIENENLVYFPNPVKDELNIVLDENTEQLIPLQIYTMDGKLIKSYLQTVTDHKITINKLENLSSGFYIITYELNQTLV